MYCYQCQVWLYDETLLIFYAYISYYLVPVAHLKPYIKAGCYTTQKSKLNQQPNSHLVEDEYLWGAYSRMDACKHVGSAYTLLFYVFIDWVP